MPRSKRRRKGVDRLQRVAPAAAAAHLPHPASSSHHQFLPHQQLPPRTFPWCCSRRISFPKWTWSSSSRWDSPDRWLSRSCALPTGTRPRPLPACLPSWDKVDAGRFFCFTLG
uniref:(northern house mosquito) hypothetical protein n=1 Tax=Culex pipiens TaxID=7175 RepID=A0A8D8NE00_CULPI